MWRFVVPIFLIYSGICAVTVGLNFVPGKLDAIVRIQAQTDIPKSAAPSFVPQNSDSPHPVVDRSYRKQISTAASSTSPEELVKKKTTEPLGYPLSSAVYHVPNIASNGSRELLQSANPGNTLRMKESIFGHEFFLSNSLPLAPARGVPLSSDATSRRSHFLKKDGINEDVTSSGSDVRTFWKQTADSAANNSHVKNIDFANISRSHPSLVTSIMGAREFALEIAVEAFVFVKFFSPRCPHCQAMAEAYTNVSKAVRAQNIPVIVTEVDCLRLVNRRICDDNVPAGYPTLKLYRKSSTLDEFHGAREADAMLTWLKRAVAFLHSPRVRHLESLRAVINFLVEADERPVVLTSIHSESGQDLQTEWNETVDYMREKSARNVAFGLVPSWKYLLGPRGFQLAENFHKIARFGAPPMAVATSSARLMLTYGSAQWWFDGVTGGDSLQTFMHIATLPGEGRAVLTSSNAEFITASSRCLVLLFDRSSGPSWDVEDKVKTLGMHGEAVALYSPSKEFTRFREHVGLSSLPPVVKASDYGKTDLVIYRAPNSGVERVIAPNNLSLSAELQIFVQKYLTWGVNMTSRKSSSSGEIEKNLNLLPQDTNITSLSNVKLQLVEDSFIILTRPRVVEVTASTWSKIIERDGRNVLLLLYDAKCGLCRRFLRKYDVIAQQLLDESRSIFVAKLDLGANDLPPYVEIPGHVPALYILVAGSAPLRYVGPLWTHRIVTFARYHSAPAHIKEVRTLQDYATPRGLRIFSRNFNLFLAIIMLFAGLWSLLLGFRSELRSARRGPDALSHTVAEDLIIGGTGTAARPTFPFQDVKMQ